MPPTFRYESVSSVMLRSASLIASASVFQLLFPSPVWPTIRKQRIQSSFCFKKQFLIGKPPRSEFRCVERRLYSSAAGSQTRPATADVPGWLRSMHFRADRLKISPFGLSGLPVTR